MDNLNPYSYTITIQEIEDDGERIYEATIAELPDAADYAETYNDAYDLAIQTIEGTAELYAESGREFPKPNKQERKYSGRITLRMPPSLHAKVDHNALKEGVSLNLYLVSIISEKQGYSIACNQIENYFHNQAESYLMRVWTSMRTTLGTNSSLNDISSTKGFITTTAPEIKGIFSTI